MTALEPRIPTPPCVRSTRQWLIALAHSALGTALGLLLLLISFGALLAEFSDQPPAGLVGMYGVDALIGVLATVLSGPLRFLPPGRLHTAAHLLLAAAVGLSIWAMPASALALYRLGVRRRAVLDVAAILLVASTSMLAMSIDSRIRGAAPEVPVLVTMGIMVVLVLLPLLMGHVVGTRHVLLASRRDGADAAERERETARRAADAAERGAAALVREHEAETARVRAEERTALARDMHDSISHHLAAIAMHSGAMAYREDLPPEALRTAASTVRDAAQQANRELRTVLSGLRTGE